MDEELFSLIPSFSRQEVSATAHKAQDKYITEKYENLLLQIQIAAENRQFATTFAAKECPIEFVSWLLQHDFNIIWESKDNNVRHWVSQPSDYFESQADRVTIIW